MITVAPVRNGKREAFENRQNDGFEAENTNPKLDKIASLATILKNGKPVAPVVIKPKAARPQPADLPDYFDQVWVINLKRRADRLKQFRRQISNANWPFRKPKVFSAIEGDKVGVPKYWQTGGGSYGCLRSHMALLERAIQDDIKSILVLEDDAIFTNTFGEDVARFLGEVPEDWHCLMLGGQHVNSSPFPVSTFKNHRRVRRTRQLQTESVSIVPAKPADRNSVVALLAAQMAEHCTRSQNTKLSLVRSDPCR